MKIAHGKQICLDYESCEFTSALNGKWMLELMRHAVGQSPAREVHSHVEEFDGSQSPPGFAAVVLLDESHVSAHCYYEAGLLAIDVFTCGNTDPSIIINIIDKELTSKMPTAEKVFKKEVKRFTNSN